LKSKIQLFRIDKNKEGGVVMAIYHLSVQIISRLQGKSCIAAAAYRSGERLYDKRQNLNHDYTKKQEVESEIIAPSNSPSWVNDREKLWNEVDKKESRCNARTAREINVALPIELSKEDQKELAREYIKTNFVENGMIADLCFHFNDKNNPHFHVMLTTREITKNGFAKKNRDWDKKENVIIWRKQWSTYANAVLRKNNIEESIDHRSLKDQGIDLLPTIHLGKTSSELQKKGLSNPRIEINNQIRALNKEKIVVLQEYRALKDKLEEEVKRYSNFEPQEKAAVQKAERLLNVPQNYENSKQALDKLNTMMKTESSKLYEIPSETASIMGKIHNINISLEILKKSEADLNRLSKNIFGHYKNQNAARTLESRIQDYNKFLANNGYKDDNTIKIFQKRIIDIEKSSEQLKLNIKSIDQDTNTIKSGVIALQTREIREFREKYKKQFSQIKYLKYYDMKSIKAVYTHMGRPISTEDMKVAYNYGNKRIDTINKELENIKNNGKRLGTVKKALETIDKFKDIADKWDTKLFGRAKFQDQYLYEKGKYDDAVKILKTYGVKDKSDLINQEHSHQSDVKNVQSKLETEKIRITPIINIAEHGIQSSENVLRAEEYYQLHKNIEATKGHRHKNREKEWGPEM
jgi:hypothetical protein